jgi:hypothetical protein
MLNKTLKDIEQNIKRIQENKKQLLNSKTNSEQTRRKRKEEETGGDKCSSNVKSLPKPSLNIPPRR